MSAASSVGAPAVVGRLRRRAKPRQVRADDAVVPREMGHPAGPGARGFRIAVDHHHRLGNRPRLAEPVVLVGHPDAGPDFNLAHSRSAYPPRCTLPLFCRRGNGTLVHNNKCSAVTKTDARPRGGNCNASARLTAGIRVVFRARRRASVRARRLSEQDDPRADPLRARRPDRRGGAVLRRASAQGARARTCWSRTSPAPPASSPSRKWRAPSPTATPSWSATSRPIA